jgi:hypothetical protein
MVCDGQFLLQADDNLGRNQPRLSRLLRAFNVVVSAQKGATPTAMAASTVRVASAIQNVPALPARTPVSQIAQATGSEASLLILQARVDAQTGSR